MDICMVLLILQCLAIYFNKMKHLTLKSLSLFLIIGLIAFNISCRKKYDEPPITQIPEGNIITIAELKAMYPGTDLSISEDYNIYANVTSEETDGNFYKEAYIQDATGAIRLRLLASGGLYIGDSIRVNLNGTVLSEYSGMIQLDSVDVDNNIVKQATQKYIQPTQYSVDQVSPALQGYLIQLNDVEFISTELGYSYADPINQFSENRTLTDCSGNTILVRTSGYANFAANTIPSDNGSIIAIVGVYNSDIQLYIRDINEVVFSNPRCTGGGGSGAILSKNFDDGSITSGGWGSFWTGTTTTENWGEWEIFGGDVASVSNFDVSIFTNYATESWLVSPIMDLSGVTAPVLTFDNVVQYSGDALELLVSTDYDGSSDPASQGTWTNITGTVPNWDFDSGDWNFVSSGNVDLSPYLSSSTYIAFKYTGTNVDGATWEIDNIIVQE